ncbi:MAG TPA: sigma-70 family RNA polymerase sigma factor [Thermoleophilaceae bacterium]
MEATSAASPRALRIPRPRRLLSAASDERLVDHIRKGEAAAFEALYDRYSGGILGFCRHMLGNASDAEDAAQHTFIAAHADIHRHDRRDLHVKAWLYTIARNRCLSMLRARRDQPSADEVELASDNLVDDVEHRADLRALLGDVTKLPDQQREALVLSEVGDLSHNEISEILGCEVSKVKSLVFQARTALIDRRIARETPCEEIREQLATLRGGALRRSQLRHHLEACPGCTEYREEIRRQRAMLALALPVVPSAALKAKVFSGISLGGGSAAAGGTAIATSASGFSFAGSGVAAKVAVVTALAAGGAGTATVATHGGLPLVHDSTPAQQQSTSHGASTKAAHGSASPAKTAATTSAAIVRKHKTEGSRRSASGTAHGFTPVTGESNGERARAFAQTRGKGKETSAARRHVTAHTRAHPVKKVRVKPVPPPARTAPTRTLATPVPKAEEPTTTAPTTTTPTTTSTTPTQTQSDRAPAGGKGSTGGKSLGSGTVSGATG